MLHELDFMYFVNLDLVGTTEVINVKVRAYRSTEREPHVVDKTEMWTVIEDSLSRWRNVEWNCRGLYSSNHNASSFVST